MSIKDIQNRIQKIKDCAGDDEVAHGLEDDLNQDFIEYVSHTPYDNDLAEKAKLVLSVGEIRFARWCA